MCNNITNAAPETHATLVATLIVKSGSIVVASPTTTSSMSLNQSSTSIVMTPTPTSSSTSTTMVPAAATSTTAAATTQSSSSSLTQAQIGGIAGGIAAIALLAALLALFILLRRRSHRSSPAFSRMRDSWSPKRVQGSPGGSLSISQPRYHEPKVMSFTRALAKRVSSKPATRRPGPSNFVGLAISPGGGRKPGTGVGLDHVVHSPVGAPPLVVRNVPPSSQPHGSSSASSSPPQPVPPLPPPMSPQRAVSSFDFFPHEPTTQLAPPPPATLRPTLARLAIPQRASMHGGRESVITEFAEDGEDGLGSAQIWRPPNTDPQSATTYYVADKWGNWVLRDERDITPPEAIAELATPISKTAEERAREEEAALAEVVEESAAVRELRHHSSPTIPEAVALPGKRASAARDGKPTIRLVTPESGRLPMNSRVRSSVYSNDNFRLPQQVVPGPDNPMPRPSAGGEELLRSGSGKGSRKRRKSDGTRRLPPERQGSRDSATTIMSQDSATTIADSPVEEMINAVLREFPLPSRQASLPEQQHQQQQQQQVDLSPVLESPGRSPVQYPAIPRSQSITINKRRSLAPRPLPNPVLAQMKQGAAAKPLKDSPTLGLLEPARPVPSDRNPAAARSAGSSNTQARKPSDRALLPSQSHARHERLSSYDAYNDPSTTKTGAQMPSMYAHPGQPPAPGQYRPRPPYRAPSPSQEYSSPPSAPEAARYYPSSANPSMNSALLAKRLGAERAAEFQRIEQQQQYQQRRYAHEQAKWSRQNANQNGGEQQVEMPALPATPGWKPQLTPKRKGDDLYLSVK